MTNEDKALARRAINMAYRGTATQQDRFEDEYGATSSLLDELGADAADAADEKLADDLLRAHCFLTGRDFAEEKAANR